MGNKPETILDQALTRLPTLERRQKGPYALFECFQPIPCNPCYTHCTAGAVWPMTNINDLPRVDYDACTGCGLCAFNCPGLAIFIIDESIGGGQALVKVPYEYIPAPQKGATVAACDRNGEIVGKATVDRIQQFNNKTTLLTLRVPDDMAHIVRGIHLGVLQSGEAFDAQMPDCPEDESIICRCEDISLEELNAILSEHNLTMAEIKLSSRAGMGPCQGRTCAPLILREISARTGKSVGALRASSTRQPIMPVKISVLAGLELQK